MIDTLTTASEAPPVATPEALVLDVVRGQRPLEELAAVGIYITFTENGCRIEPEPSIDVAPTVDDLVAGLRVYQHDPDALHYWALVMMSISALDFEPLQLDPRGEDAIGALWDASFTGRVDEAVLQAVERRAA